MLVSNFYSKLSLLLHELTGTLVLLSPLLLSQGKKFLCFYFHLSTTVILARGVPRYVSASKKFLILFRMHTCLSWSTLLLRTSKLQSIFIRWFMPLTYPLMLEIGEYVNRSICIKKRFLWYKNNYFSYRVNWHNIPRVSDWKMTLRI